MAAAAAAAADWRHVRWSPPGGARVIYGPEATAASPTERAESGTNLR